MNINKYLSGRKQRILIEKSLSETVEVRYDVPQESVLATILFNISTTIHQKNRKVGRPSLRQKKFTDIYIAKTIRTF